MKAVQFDIPLKAGQTTKLGLFSDEHIDSPDCDIETLRKHLAFCIKDGRAIISNGDLFDAILLKDQKRAVNHLMEQGDNQINTKLQKVAEFLDPFKNNIIMIGRGNHEESILKYSGIDLIQMLVLMLNADKKSNIQVGNYANFIRFAWKNSQDKQALNYDIYMHHGAGANAPITKGMLDFSRIARGVNADLIWIGHKHNSLIDASDPIVYIDNNGEVRIKNRQCIQTPSYQKGRSIDYNVNFAERFYSNTAMSGFGKLDMTPVYEDYKLVLNTELKIETNPRLKIGDVINQQLKVRSR